MSSTSTGDSIYQLTPYEFEAFVAELWEARGFDTHVRQKSNDRGIDIEATKDGTKELIQVKQYNPENKIGSEDVRKYRTLYQQVPDADNVVIVTASSFTGPARDLGDDLDVTLINGKGVERMMNRNDVDMDNISVEGGSSGLTGFGKFILLTAVGALISLGLMVLTILMLLFGVFRALTGVLLVPLVLL